VRLCAYREVAIAVNVPNTNQDFDQPSPEESPPTKEMHHASARP
jgi:hypothetical protein